MIAFLLRRVVYTLPIMLGVALVCFALVHLSPGDPLVSILPPDASAELQQQLIRLYGFDRSYPEQFASWVWRALQGDLGTSIASGRAVTEEVFRAVGNTLRLAVLATLIGFVFGCLFGFVAGYFQNSWLDKAASLTSVLGVSVPHYWLGMLMVIVFSATLAWLPPGGAGPGGSGDWAWDWPNENCSFPRNEHREGDDAVGNNGNDPTGMKNTWASILIYLMSDFDYLHE